MLNKKAKEFIGARKEKPLGLYGSFCYKIWEFQYFIKQGVLKVFSEFHCKQN